MADTAVAITAGTGTNIDTRTEGTNGNHRQVVVLGDPATNAGVAPVDATNGLAVQIIPALPAGTNAIGKLAANSGVDIGDVDVTSVPTDPFGANADAASATGSVSAKLRAIATALGTTALDLGAGTGGTRTLRVAMDTGQLDPTVAHDAADSGNPYKDGGRAVAGLSGITLVAANDRTDGLHGLDGARYVRPHCGLEDIVSGVAAITDGSSTSVIASAGAGVKNYITSVMIANTSATAVTVDLRDGAAGTVKATLPVPANTSGVVCNYPIPLPFSAATAVCADPSAAASTVTVTLIGFKSKV